jgi:pantothenate kinase type III
MLLVLDVGNTNTVLGVFAKSSGTRYDQMIANWRVTTLRSQTVDEYGVLFRNLFSSPGRFRASLSRRSFRRWIPRCAASASAISIRSPCS